MSNNYTKNPYMHYGSSSDNQPSGVGSSGGDQGQIFQGQGAPQSGQQEQEVSFDTVPAPARFNLSAITKSPAATTSLLLGAAVIVAVGAGVFIFGGDDAPQSNSDVPVIKAQVASIKGQPEEAGGMDIPHQDNTIYSTLRSADASSASGAPSNDRPIENLLDPKPEAPVENRAEAMVESSEIAALQVDEAADVEPAAGVQEPEESEAKPLIEEAAEAPKPASQKVAKIKQEREYIPPEKLAGNLANEKPDVLHKPGSSPETIAYVRSVLERKDGGAQGKSQQVASNDSAASTAEALNNIAPAAGAAGSAGQMLKPGGYFVQLASVTSQSGAHSEWGKLQDKYSGLLQAADYRVQSADLGSRGTFYRIQAGPMSRDDATRICEGIKAQNPGGCLVVK